MGETKRAVIPWWVFALFTGVGIIMLIVGGFLTSRTSRFLESAVEAPGEVVDISSYTDDDGQTMYQPVIRFTAQDGEDYEITGSTGSSWAPELGRQVTVLYNPDSPQLADLKGFWNQWLGPVIFLGLGGLIFVLGVVLWFFLRGKPVPVSDGGVDFILDD